MNFDQIVCPISTNRIDSHVSRLTVFVNAVLLAFFLYISSPVFIVIVTIDYGIRAFLRMVYSPVRFVVSGIPGLLKIQAKEIDAAPKIFASRLGLLCSFASSVLLISGLPVASKTVAGILMVFASLDSICNFCVGCIIYHYLVFPFYNKKLNR